MAEQPDPFHFQPKPPRLLDGRSLSDSFTKPAVDEQAGLVGHQVKQASELTPSSFQERFLGQVPKVL
jgi:hypothetical protein